MITTSSPSNGLPSLKFPVRVKTITSPSLGSSQAATIACVLNFNVRSTNPSGPSSVQSRASSLKKKGSNGVATSSILSLIGDTPSSSIVLTSISKTSIYLLI